MARILVLACLATLLFAAVSGCAGGPKGKGGDDNIVTQTGEPVPDAASLTGMVIDDQNAPVPDATVVLVEAQLEARTDEAGGFSFLNLVPGKYRLIATKLAYTQAARLIELGPQAQETVTISIEPLPTPEPYYETQTKEINIQVGFAWFVAVCDEVTSGITCNAAAVPAPNVRFAADDPEYARLATIVLEEEWTPNSAVCAKSVSIGVYNPGAPSITDPSPSNPHYWANADNPRTTITNPITFVIPRNETGNPDAIDDEARVDANGGDLDVDGQWTVRNFPTGHGLTNLPVDVNCFTDQDIQIYWTTFYMDPAPPGFSARPDA